MKAAKATISVFLLSVALASPASANYFSNPQTGLNLNVGSAPNPAPRARLQISRLEPETPPVVAQATPPPAPVPQVPQAAPAPPPPQPAPRKCKRLWCSSISIRPSSQTKPGSLLVK